MGMYTELNLCIEFKKSVNRDFLYTISEMVKDSMYIKKGNEKVLFESERSSIMFKCSSSYFVDIVISKLNYNKYTERWELFVHSNFKNYDNDIEKFIEFIMPHIERKGFIGYSRYEEVYEPTLYFKE